MFPQIQKLIAAYNKFKEKYPELADALAAILANVLFPAAPPVMLGTGSEAEAQAVADFQAECASIIAE